MKKLARRTLVYYNVFGTFKRWVITSFQMKGGGKMSKKDFLIFSLIIIILLLIALLFVILK